MLLKHYLDRGVSKAELSRRFGVNRRTIHNWVDTGQLDRDLAAGARGYSPRPPVAHKLDPYEAIIDARLEAFPSHCKAPRVSASTIARLKEVWQGELEHWQRRDLSAKRYVYFWADGVYFSPRLDHDKQCMCVIIGADELGRKELLAIADGYREDDAAKASPRPATAWFAIP